MDLSARMKPLNSVDRLPGFIGGILLSGFGNLLYEVSSQFSYMLGKTYGFAEGGQGDFVASFFAGYTIVAITMVFWIRRVDWRLIAFGSALAAGIGFASLLEYHTYISIMVAMFIAGIGMGACYALSLTVFAESTHPTRAFGLKFFFDVVPGAGFNLFMPSLFAKHGFAGVSVSILCFAALIMATSVLLPSQGKKADVHVASGISIKEDGPALWGCFSSFALVLGVMSLLSFLGQVGVHKGFGMSPIGSLLAVGDGLNASGALIAVAVGTRFGSYAPVWSTLLTNIAMLFVIGGTAGFVPFAIGALVFCLTNNFTLTYTMAMIGNLDRRGHLAPFASACFSAGAIFGPLLAGHLLEIGGIGLMLTLPATAWIAAWLSYAHCYRLDRRTQAAMALA